MQHSECTHWLEHNIFFIVKYNEKKSAIQSVQVKATKIIG